MNNRFLKYAGIAALFLTMTSCSDDSNTIDMGPGTFKIVITGDVETEFEGFALFSEFADQINGRLFFAMSLISNQGENIKTWFVRSGQFPGNDTYLIELFAREDMDDIGWVFGTDEFVGFFIREVELEQDLFFSDSGTITLQLTTDNTMYGDFEFVASGRPRYSMIGEAEPEQMDVHISGRFNAMFGEIQFPVF
jgi:hypothetical protein